MKKKILINLSAILLFSICTIAPATGTIYYSYDGKKIDKAEYEKIISKRASDVKAIQIEGYKDNSADLIDPVLLRKKRIEQWKQSRDLSG